MNYKKSELSSFAKALAQAHRHYLDVSCIAEEIVKSDIGRSLQHDTDSELLIEISKRYAKYVQNTCCVDIDTGETQECQSLLNAVIGCCEENHWL